jgi:probable HAF family extracellular repeat protein
MLARDTRLFAFAFLLLAAVTPAHAALIYTLTDLGTLGGFYSSANAINSTGQVVGSSMTASGRTHAFRTSADAAINPATDDLGTLGGIESYGYAINASGQVAGQAFLGSLAHRSENARSAVFSRASLHCRQFLLWNQERGESCKKPPTPGVKTPRQPPRPTPQADITSVPDFLAHRLMKLQTTRRKRLSSLPDVPGEEVELARAV